jgi:hypothetical protein
VHINQKGMEVAEGNNHDECIYKRYTEKRRRILKKTNKEIKNIAIAKGLTPMVESDRKNSKDQLASPPIKYFVVVYESQLHSIFHSTLFSFYLVCPSALLLYFIV